VRHLTSAVMVQSSAFLVHQVPVAKGGEADGLGTTSCACLFRDRIAAAAAAETAQPVSDHRRDSPFPKCQDVADAGRVGQEKEASDSRSFHLERKLMPPVLESGLMSKSSR